jgi:hypothetical protein
MKASVHGNQSFIELSLKRCQGQVVWRISKGLFEFSRNLVNAYKARDRHKVEYTGKCQVVHVGIVQQGKDKDNNSNKDGR